jgi:glycosyltransferase involved in cell wall biosynthesis
MQAGEVAVLLAVRNGMPHLPTQLDSIAAQTHPDWHLIAGDDASSDASPAALAAFAAAHPGRVRIVEGPRRGAAAHFLHLLALAGPTVPHAAFSDQDDVWLPFRLARAVAALAAVPARTPALYCARTLICDAALNRLAEAPHWPRPLGFANALVQNACAGNTIVLNRAALTLAQAAAPAALRAGIAVHDWWLYLLVSGAGGQVIRDREPVLLYRQHAGNHMGRNDTAAAALARLRRIAAGDWGDWIGRNIAALTPEAHRLTPESRAMLAAFDAARRSGPVGRLAAIRRLGLYRQTRAGQAALWLAALLGRV